MESPQGRRARGKAAEELILRTVAAHADSLLRTARRYSLCPDDAQDAYQRALEIFMAHADRLDGGNAAGWLHVVVKREAHAIRSSRQKLVGANEVDLDAHEAQLPTSDERLATFDLVGRAAEALQRLKPQELRALWLKAEGHSYNEICALTGWSYTKVNRCLTEGRRSFLTRYATIESGAECERWLPVISAMVDGEATPEQMIDLRPHLRNCPGCRATLATLQSSSAPLGAILPVPLALATLEAGDHVSNSLMRLYEMVVAGFHERAAPSLVKVQAVIETTTAGKAAAIAGAAAAVAGGGYATIERSIPSIGRPPAKVQQSLEQGPAAGARMSLDVAVARRVSGSNAKERVDEFDSVTGGPSESLAPEFGGGYARTGVGQSGETAQVLGRASESAAEKPRNVAPEFASEQTRSDAPEFGP